MRHILADVTNTAVSYFNFWILNIIHALRCDENLLLMWHINLIRDRSIDNEFMARLIKICFFILKFISLNFFKRFLFLFCSSFSNSMLTFTSSSCSLWWRNVRRGSSARRDFRFEGGRKFRLQRSWAERQRCSDPWSTRTAPVEWWWWLALGSSRLF